MDYVPREGDLAVKEVDPGHFEVSVYSEDETQWNHQAFASLTELRKLVRNFSLLYKHKDWDYYRRTHPERVGKQ